MKEEKDKWKDDSDELRQPKHRKIKEKRHHKPSIYDDFNDE